MDKFQKVDLKKEILTKFKPIIESWTDEDIYAISFFVYDEDDNPCKPTVTLGYNTGQQLANEKQSADEQEARWNYAYWLQNQEYIFGYEDETDEIIIEWINENGFPYDEDFCFPSHNYSEEENEQFFNITKAFVEVLISVVQELHSSSFIKTKFNKEIPVLIHELEYYDAIAKQNIEANGINIIDDFIDFCGYTI